MIISEQQWVQFGVEQFWGRDMRAQGELYGRLLVSHEELRAKSAALLALLDRVRAYIPNVPGLLHEIDAALGVGDAGGE